MLSTQLDGYVRAAVILVGLVAVVYLATFVRSEAAGGALLSLLSMVAGYLFRGRVEPPKE